MLNIHIATNDSNEPVVVRDDAQQWFAIRNFDHDGTPTDEWHVHRGTVANSTFLGEGSLQSVLQLAATFEEVAAHGIAVIDGVVIHEEV